MSDNNNNIPEYNQQPNGYIVASALPPNGYYIPQNTTPVPGNPQDQLYHVYLINRLKLFKFFISKLPT